MPAAASNRPEENDDAIEPGLPEPPSGLTQRQDQAIAALLAEPTISKAAAKVGVHERTLHRWLEDPAFSREYRRCRREVFSHAIALTVRYAPLAANTLAKLMNDPDTPPHARVTASVALLRFGREGIELDDLAGRIEVLEQAANATKRN